MKIYWIKAQAPRRVLALVKHLGLQAEFIEPDLMKGGLKALEFAALNPNKKAPVLVDGDVVLWESSAIMAYLCIKAGSNMWPANNPAEQTNLRGEGDFFSDMTKNALPRAGGVFYIRGGYYNLNYPKQSAVIQNPNYPNKNGLTPTELAAIKTAKSGDDDHPSYSDSQLSEAIAARVINAIAANEDIWERLTVSNDHGFR